MMRLINKLKNTVHIQYTIPKITSFYLYYLFSSINPLSRQNIQILECAVSVNNTNTDI